MADPGGAGAAAPPIGLTNFCINVKSNSRMHQNPPFSGKNSIFFGGEGHSPLPRPLPVSRSFRVTNFQCRCRRLQVVCNIVVLAPYCFVRLLFGKVLWHFRLTEFSILDCSVTVFIKIYYRYRHSSRSYNPCLLGCQAVVKLVSHRWGIPISNTGLYGPTLKVSHIFSAVICQTENH